MLSVVPALGQSFNQEMIPYRKGKLWGYCDAAKNILIKPAYDETLWFNIYKAENGEPEQQLAIVKKNGKMGLINRKGKLVTACEYDHIDPYSYHRGILLFKDGKSKLYHVDNGKILTDASLPDNWTVLKETVIYTNKYRVSKVRPDIIRVVKEKAVWENQDYKYAVTDSADFEADSLYQFADHNGTDSAFFIVKNGKKGLITLGGNQLLPVKYDSLVRVRTDYELGSESVFCLQNNLWEIAYPFASGSNTGIPPKPIQGQIEFGTGYYFLNIKKESGWGVMSSNGKMIIPAVYDSVINMHFETVYALKKNGSWELKRPDNRAVNTNRYLDVKPVTNQFMCAKRADNRWILMLQIDKEIFPHKNLFPAYSYFSDNFLSVYKDKEEKDRLGWAHIDGTCYWD